MIDELGPLDIPDYERTIDKEMIRVDSQLCEITELSRLLGTTLVEDLFAGIETVLYASNNIFTGEIESINFTYLNKDLKNYSLTNAIDRNLL